MKKQIIMWIVVVLLVLLGASIIIKYYVAQNTGNIKIIYSEKIGKLSNSEENKIKDIITNHYFSDPLGGGYPECKEIETTLDVVEILDDKSSIHVLVYGCGSMWTSYFLKKDNGEWKIEDVGYAVPQNEEPVVDGYAGVYYPYWDECCENWAEENNILKTACVGNWTVENNVCKWVCETG